MYVGLFTLCSKNRNFQTYIFVRLIADPNVSVNQIQTCFESYMKHMGNSDLWHLVSPPASGPRAFNWKSPVNASWLVKTIGLLYELLLVAPNSKFLSTKVTQAACIFSYTSVIRFKACYNKTLEFWGLTKATLHRH